MNPVGVPTSKLGIARGPDASPSAAAPEGVGSHPVNAIRAEFPMFREPRTPPLAYLDSAATSQKPDRVLRALDDHYARHNANIHRGIYRLAEEATQAYEDARRRIARFIGSTTPREVVFTSNATESINLVAYAWGRSVLRPGDAILLTEMEHHSNLVPWQILAKERGAELRFIPVTDRGELDLAAVPKLLADGKVKLLAAVHVSNVLGTINPIAELADQARTAGAVVLVDASQSAPHRPLDVQRLRADFVAFTGHKMLGPTGIGVLWGRRALLEAMPPFLAGGEMIREVGYTESKWNELPWKFEAGTMPIAEAVGLGAAVDYLDELGMAAIAEHEQTLVRYALDRLAEVPGLRVLGPTSGPRGGLVAFTLDGIHPHDVATVLDSHGVAVRAGHHCAMPLHRKLGIPASVRASFHCYTVTDEIDALVRGLGKVREVFGR